MGNPDYPAISYGGYRETSRTEQPTLDQLKEDMRILHAMGIRFLRTYNVQLPHAGNVVQAIAELKQEDPDLRDVRDARALGSIAPARGQAPPNHAEQDYEANEAEIDRAVALAQQYRHRQGHRRRQRGHGPLGRLVLRGAGRHPALGQPPAGPEVQGDLPADLWITSSTTSPLGAVAERSTTTPTSTALIQAVDFVSMHTYPFHDTHYNPTSGRPKGEGLRHQRGGGAMARALAYSQNQYAQVVNYVRRIDADKSVHIGETGWASVSDGFYGPEGSRAADELKQALFHQGMRNWTQSGISCFYFEAFNEPWKSAANPTDSENHFGLFKVDGEAKHALWLPGGTRRLRRPDPRRTAHHPQLRRQRDMLDRHVLTPRLDHETRSFDAFLLRRPLLLGPVLLLRDEKPAAFGPTKGSSSRKTAPLHVRRLLPPGARRRGNARL